MNIEGSEQWRQERWEEFEHYRWELIQKLEHKYYELYKSDPKNED